MKLTNQEEPKKQGLPGRVTRAFSPNRTATGAQVTNRQRNVTRLGGQTPKGS